jgi:hypothetical protein
MLLFSHDASGLSNLFPIPHQEQFAQDALEHNSKAVHRAYAKRAMMKLPSLEDCELKAAAKVGPGE